MDIVRNQILEEAHALYTRYGLKSVSMDDVARKVGISKKTLYQHFAKKEDLIKEVMQCNYEQDLEHFSTSMNESTDAIDEFLRNSRYFVREMRQISPTLFYDMQKYYGNIWLEQTQAHMGYFEKSIQENIMRGVEEGLYREDLIPSVITRIYQSTVMALMDTSLFPAHEISLDRIIQQQSLYHLYGIITPAGRNRLLEHLEREQL
ncbi:MAG: TetR/AcrR family transcriptional regulator [Bacteroidota bacterium]